MIGKRGGCAFFSVFQRYFKHTKKVGKMLTKEKYGQYVSILQEELVPAMGCTEPISIAYAAAKARATLGEKPISGKLEVSGNIVKNVRTIC